MAISAKDVMTLRQRTGVGMMECKAALNDANGDMDAAIALLRERLKGQMDERSERAASEGAIAIARRGDAVAMIELLSETDFAARNDGFVAAAQKIADLALAGADGEVAPTDAMKHLVDDLRITIKENISLGKGVKLSGGKAGAYLHHNRKVGAIVLAQGDFSDDLLTGLCQHVVASVPTPLAVDEAGLAPAALQEQKDKAAEEAKASGKPQQIIEKMVQGKVRKWVDEQTLLGQIYIRELDAKKPVRDYLPKGGKVVNFARFQLGA